MNAGISRTMVLPASNPLPNQKIPICAFYSIAPSSISRETLPESRAKKLPKYPVPVFLLAQLAVHREFHGEGLGKICLIKALEYLWDINAHMRAYAIVVDCLTESAERFYAKYGFEVLCKHNDRMRMFIPMNTVEQLFT
jgi:GNAT superfamily N-acetyltransferase